MNDRSRLSRVRRRLLEDLKEEVRLHIGPTPESLRRYYEDYKAEFSGRWTRSSKDELIGSVREARIVMVGDYHTLRQSQRTNLRILRELLPGKRRIRLGLELVHSAHQGHLDRFLAGEASLKELLRGLRYHETWGQPWEGYGELLEFAAAHGIPVHGLNRSGRGVGLRVRDRHAARLVAGLAVRYPEDLIHVVFGDLHLAAGHLPRYTVEALGRAGVKGVAPVIIFQNSETLFWKLHRRRLQHRVDVLRRGRSRFCINSTPPWVKLHSFVFWERNRDELLEALMAGGRGIVGAGGGAVEFSEQQASLIRVIADYFELRPPGMDDFTVLTLAELNRFIGTLGRLKRFDHLEPLLAVRDSLFIPERRIIFLRGPDINHAAEQGAVFLNWLCTRYAPRPDGGQDEFYRRVLRRALGFVGSLVINPRRKHWHEADHVRYLDGLSRRRVLSRRGRAQREASRWVLRHIDRWPDRGGRSAIRSVLAIDDRCLRLVSTGLGQIIGYRLYHGMLQGAVARNDVAGLFSMNPGGPGEARDLYADLEQQLRMVVPLVISKSHRF